MLAQFQDLIDRLKMVVSDESNRPLLLHWSDVTLLQRIYEEMKEDDERIERLRNVLNLAIDQAVAVRRT